MPMLDVSDAILDPMFCSRVCITRRPYINDATQGGKVVITPTECFFNGVITQGSPSAFQQTADAQNAKAVITVHAYRFQLFDPITLASTGAMYQPDLVNYNGNIYIVDRVLNWSQYGAGFTQAEASLYQMTETGNYQ